MLTWGLTYKTSSAKDCCDRCKAHKRGCNSWTFCGLPVCWGLDTGHNHTFGEFWLRRLKSVKANNSFRQRGRYTRQWLRKHRLAGQIWARPSPRPVAAFNRGLERGWSAGLRFIHDVGP